MGGWESSPNFMTYEVEVLARTYQDITISHSDRLGRLNYKILRFFSRFYVFKTDLDCKI